MHAGDVSMHEYDRNHGTLPRYFLIFLPRETIRQNILSHVIGPPVLQNTDFLLVSCRFRLNRQLVAVRMVQKNGPQVLEVHNDVGRRWFYVI